MTEADTATTTTNATLNHNPENEPNHDPPPPNHPEIKSTSSNISASNNNNNSMINNPTPHRLPEGENAAPLEVTGTTTSDKLVIIMVGLPATGACEMCVCV